MNPPCFAPFWDLDGDFLYETPLVSLLSEILDGDFLYKTPRRRRKILGFYIVFALENTILKRFLVKILNIFAKQGGFYTKNPHPKSQKGAKQGGLY